MEEVLSELVPRDIYPGMSYDTLVKLQEYSNRASRQRKRGLVSATLTPVDSLERFIQLSSHPLHQLYTPGILAVDIHPTQV